MRASRVPDGGEHADAAAADELVTDSPPVDLTARAARGLAWTLLRSVSSRLVGILVFVVLARLLAPADFGTVALASVFVVLIQLLVNGGFAEALIQRDRLVPRDLDSAFWVSNAVGLALAALLFLGADLVSAPFHQPQLPPVLRALSVVLVLSALSSVPQAVLRRAFAFRALAVRSIVATVAGGVVGVAMALAGTGVWALVGQLIATQLVDTVVLWMVCDWRPRFRISRRSVHELGSFALNILGGRLAMFTSRRSDDFLVGLVLGAVALGLYTTAYRILWLLTEVVFTSVEAVALPLLSRLQAERVRLARAFYGLTQVCLAIAVPLFVTVSILAGEVTSVVFGPQWDRAAPVMQVLALVGIPHAVAYCCKSALDSAGRPQLSLRVAVLTGVLNIIGFLVVVRWGIVAVATSYVVCAYLLVPVSVSLVRRAVGIHVRTFLRALLPPLISGLFMAGSLLVLTSVTRGHVSDLSVLGLGVGLSAVTYTATLAVTGRTLLRTVMAHAGALLARR